MGGEAEIVSLLCYHVSLTLLLALCMQFESLQIFSYVYFKHRSFNIRMQKNPKNWSLLQSTIRSNGRLPDEFISKIQTRLSKKSAEVPTSEEFVGQFLSLVEILNSPLQVMATFSSLSPFSTSTISYHTVAISFMWKSLVLLWCSWNNEIRYVSLRYGGSGKRSLH